MPRHRHQSSAVYADVYTRRVATTLRVSEATRDAVNRAAAEAKTSADGVISRAMELYETAVFWEQHRQAVAARTAEELDAERAEMAPWDRAAAADLRSSAG